jgi:hypothetical protein
MVAIIDAIMEQIREKSTPSFSDSKDVPMDMIDFYRLCVEFIFRSNVVVLTFVSANCDTNSPVTKTTRK